MKLIAFIVFSIYIFKTGKDMIQENNKKFTLDIIVLTVSGMIMIGG